MTPEEAYAEAYKTIAEPERIMKALVEEGKATNLLDISRFYEARDRAIKDINKMWDIIHSIVGDGPLVMCDNERSERLEEME
jgi:hypothetical protein